MQLLKTMEIEDIYTYFKNLSIDDFSLAYMGDFDDELTSSLMEANETSINEQAKFKKKISFLVAESFQNIIRHKEKPEVINRTNNKPNFFLIRNVGNQHYISSCNLISNTKKEDLSEKLKSINTLSEERLKEVYLDALENNEISEKGGGGLGLIEMARKSKFPLEFDFEFVNFYYSSFYMQIHFTSSERGGEIIPSTINKQCNIHFVKDLYTKMLGESVLMIRKGDFSQESILPLIGLLESNLKTQSDFLGSKTKTIYILIELLQNISKHGTKINDKHEGFFAISKKKEKYVLSSGNYIHNNIVESFKQKLDTTTNLNETELKELYTKIILSEEQNIKGNAGVGLIEMIKYSSEKIKYSFTKIDEEKSFFSLSVTI